MHGHILLSHGQLPYEFVRQIRRGASYLSDKSAAKYFFFLIYANIFRIFLMYPQKKMTFAIFFCKTLYWALD